jgi:hypothetical protein
MVKNQEVIQLNNHGSSKKISKIHFQKFIKD